ncbi:MAG: RcpC/CpaB family pilus assembly protein [Maioricimonas sp. JB049]
MEAKKKGRSRSRSAKRRDLKIPLIFALVLAVLAFGILMVGGQDSVSTDDLYVVRATGNITAFHELNEDDLEAVPMEPELFEVAVTDLEGVTTTESRLDRVFAGATAEEALAAVQLELGKTTLQPIHAGEVVYVEDLTLTSRYADVVSLNADQQLISVEALPAKAVAGEIKPGERVDVFAVDTDNGLATRMLEDVTVVSVNLAESALEGLYSTQTQDPGLDTDTLLPADPYPGIYTLRVHTDDALKFTLAANHSNISVVLAVRSDLANEASAAQEPGDPVTPPDVVDILDLFCDKDAYRPGAEGTDGQLTGEITIDVPPACARLFAELDPDNASENPILDPEFDGLTEDDLAR